MKYGYLLIGLALAICVGLFYIGADDSDAAGSGTLRDPYSSDPRLSSDEAKTIYVYTGTAFNIRFNATSTIVSVTSGHGLTSPVDTRLTGTLTGSNGDRVYVDMENHGSLFSHTIICVTPTHTATWNNWDGSCITSTSFNHGATPVYSGATPTRPADSQYVYEFTGWSPTPRASYDDVSYTAQYSSTVNTYTVTWVDWDGTVLETDSDVPYGTTPTYDGTTPVRPMDSQYMYEFAGWSPAVGPISGDTTYTAQIPAIWQYTLSSSDATIVAYLGSGGTGVDIEIPSSVTYNGTTYPVRTVGDGTNPVIPSTITGRNLVIPDSVYVIENHAFRRCTGLIGTLTLGSSITSIGDSAFADCSGLTGNLVIPNSVTSIDSGAFQNCSGFTGNLVIPDSITIIEHMVFAGCSGLNGTLTIGNSVTIIGKSAFVSTGFTGDLVIPNSVNSIGDTAFSGCRGFTGNLIISWDTTLGTDVFLYSGNLHFPYQFKNYDGTVLQSGYVLYNNTPSYTGSTPVKPSTSTETYHFNGWSPTPDVIIKPVRYTAQYTTVNIFTVVWKDWNGTVLETDVGVEEGTTPTYDGATPTRPDQYQFTYSFSTWSPAVGPITGYTEYTAVYTETALWSYSLNIHTPTATIEGYLGSGGTDVDIIIPSVVLENNVEYTVTHVGVGGSNVIPTSITGRNLVIPDTVTDIENRAFDGCRGLTGTLTIGDSVTKIGGIVFNNCSGLTGNLVIPDSVETIGVQAFRNCSGFNGTLTLGDSLQSIGGGAFAGCRGFTGNLVIPDSVTSISLQAFQLCRGFNGLTIGNSVTSIGNSAFDACSGFTGDLVIPNSVTTIGSSAFNNCTGLNGNLIISWDTSFSDDSFTGCTSLHFPTQFKNYDGTLLQEGYVLYGQIPAYSGSTPAKPMDEDYEYAFAGWSPTPVAIQIPSRYTAEFTPLFRYTVTWTNWDDSVLLTDKWADGTTPVYSGATPTRPATVQYTYEFSSWTPTPVAIHENTTFKADFTGTLIVYDFGDWQYVLDDNYDVVISHNTEREGVLQIPVVADGYAVKSFNGGNMVQATGIIIPRSITAVANDAFSGSGITEVLNLSDVPITGTSHGLNNATVYTSVPGWMYINDTTYTERVPDDSPTSGLIRIIPLLIIIGIIVHILRNRVGNGDE